MLFLKLNTTVGTSPDGTQVFLQDATGNYDAATNPTGYGTVFGDPNPFRGNIAVFPLAFFRNFKGQESEIQFEPYQIAPGQFSIPDPNYVAKPQQDGWYLFSLVHTQTAVSPVSFAYTEGAVVFDTTTYKLLQKKDGNFVEIQPSALRGTASEGEILEHLHIAGTARELIELEGDKVDLYIDSENLSNKKKIALIQEYIDRTRSILVSSHYQWLLGNKSVAARQLDFLSKNRYAQF